MAKIKISDLIIDFIASQGVNHVFMISGGGNMHLVDSAAKHGTVKYICNHHEQASAMAAESYGRLTGNFGVCIVTVGPAATNTLTGVAGAWLDSIPTLYISGQVRRDIMLTGKNLRQMGVQEINIIDMARPITKYAEVVMEPGDIKYHLQKAVFLAKNGRPGPAYLDIPSDIQAMMVEESELREFDSKLEGLEIKNSENFSNLVKQALTLITQAKRPVIFAGNGIRLVKAQSNFLKLAEVLNVPVLTSMSAHDLIASDHRLAIGRPGVFGDRAGNFAIQNCDVLLSIGARHHLWNIGYTFEAFARGAKKIVVDIDEAELKKKSVIPDLPIQADAGEFIKELLNQFSQNTSAVPSTQSWLKQCQEWKIKYPVVLPEYKDETDFVNSYFFTEMLSKQLSEKAIVLTGVGTSFTGTLQSIKIKQGQELHCNVGCASMGWDLPAAIGASFARGGEEIVLITGEGSIMMNLQELQTISYYQLPIKIFLLNNNGYLAIKNTQNSFFDGNLAAVDESSGLNFPKFSQVAQTFGFAYESIKNHQDNLEEKISKVLKHKGPMLCEIYMPPNQPLVPKVFSQKNPDGTMTSKPLEDMYPFLDREEFKKNMYIPLWEK